MSRAELLLALGAGLGVALAAAGIVRAPAERLTDDAVAMVNGQPIRRDDYQTALAAVAADRRGGSDDPATRQHVLDRLIDEELLVQAALELGLAQRDRRVRADLASAAIGFLTEAPADGEPTESELRAFHAEHAGYFAHDAAVQVEHWFFAAQDAEADGAARARAERARSRILRGEPADGDPPPLDLPRGPLPLVKLEQYLGPTATRLAAELEPGEVSQPIRGAQGYQVLRLVARTAGTPPRFEEVRDSVRAEWGRRQSERRLRRFVEQRRARAALVLAPEVGR